MLIHHPEHIKNLDQFHQPSQQSSCNLSSCNLCVKFLQYIIEQHITQNNDEKNHFHCQKCDKEFGAAFDLHQHQRDKHKLAVCKACGKEVKDLKKVLCEEHNTNKKKNVESPESIPKKLAYFCDICNRVFLKLEDIRKHDQSKHGISKKSKKRR
ncbi:6868_t:CDS:1 [Dentiscutata erythropus]|uniref:6868_t:CDS:1 n=1 Tax=Dentiscutata erythropus TaxID=1348616 RepID=A0A9N9DG77_9GLOM|nr:6868_t:CDS:1 [Dentiscutata erythropus]